MRRMRPRFGGREGAEPLPAGFGAIWSTVAVDMVGFGIVLPLLPLYAERFGAGPATAGLLVASFSLAQAVFAPLWGRVSDRVGRKPVLVLSLVGTAVGSLLTGLAGELWVLFLGRVLDGASGASVSVAQAAVADVAPPEARARLQGLLGAAFGIGFVAGPALGALGALGGPHVPFLLAAALAGANAVAAVRRLPETGPGRAPRSGSPRTSAPEVIRAVGSLVAVAFVVLVAFSAFEATFALLGERRLGLELSSTGLVFAAVGLLIVIVNVRLVPAAVRRLGSEGALRSALVADAAGLALLAVAHSWFTLVPALVLLTVGQGLVNPTLAVLVGARAGPEHRGEALGVQQAAGSLARVVGPAAGGLAFERLGSPAPYLAGAALTVLAVTLVRSRPAARRVGRAG